MGRPKIKSDATRTCVVIEKYSVLKQYSASMGWSFRDFINRAIYDYIMLKENEYFNLRYFKKMAKK